MGRNKFGGSVVEVGNKFSRTLSSRVGEKEKVKQKRGRMIPFSGGGMEQKLRVGGG